MEKQKVSDAVVVKIVRVLLGLLATISAGFFMFSLNSIKNDYDKLRNTADEAHDISMQNQRDIDVFYRDIFDLQSGANEFAVDLGTAIISTMNNQSRLDKMDERLEHIQDQAQQYYFQSAYLEY